MSNEKPTNTKNTSNPYKSDVFDAYVAWRSFPAFLREAKHKDIADQLNLDEQLVSNIISIRTQTEFAHKYGVEQSTLSNWNKLIAEHDTLGDSRQWANGLVKNVIFALYKNALKTGDARSCELFFKVVNGWNQRQPKQSEHRCITQFNIQSIKQA